MLESRTKAADGAKPAAAAEEVRKKLADYRALAPTLTPEQAAGQWLALFDAFSALSTRALNNFPGSTFAGYNRDRLSVQSFFQALPPTGAWEALAREIEARQGGNEWREKGLRLLATVLRGDAAGRERLLKELRTMAENPKQVAGMDLQVLDSLEEQLAMLGDEGAQLAAFEKRLATEEAHPDRLRGGAIGVPALVKLAGREKAQTLLQRVLLLDGNVDISDEETRRLGAAVALQSAGRLLRPSWGLVREIEDGPLFEALTARFARTGSEGSYQYGAAAMAYLVGLVANGRTKDAAKFATDAGAMVSTGGSFMAYGSVDYLVRRGLSRQVNDFLRELLSGDPALHYWSVYIQLSARLGESDRALAFLREVAARPDLSPEAQRATSRHEVDALLAADDIDEGVKILRAMNQKGPAPERADQPGRGDGMSQHIERCLRLAQLGRLLEHPEWTDEGVAAAVAGVSKPTQFYGQQTTEQVLQLLVSLGRGPEAEKLESEFSPDANGMNDFVFNDRTEKLATIYHLAGRHADVLQLLEQSPYWSTPDLSGLSGKESMRVPLLFAAAKALAVAGRKDEARRVVNRLLEQKGGYDPGYALLLELGGDGLEARLDELARRDRFQERPLIWKAKLQYDTGRLEEAEKTVRAAIAIDPSDGEEGKGDRMRAYAVLGDILEKRGDAAQAKIMRGAVEAIRLSENADDWWQAGLLRRAVKMYEEALGHFADAYCIQSRLALRYSELGDMAKAEEHYQRAFELMPGSFGRIESHCFGCEGAFTGDRAQNIAERVFTKLAADPAARPQVFYLLGYLREQQNRAAESAVQFQRAVQLDPDYFNAWSHLRDAARRANLAGGEADAATLALLRLDPTVGHHYPSFQDVRDLRSLWDAILAAEKNRSVLDEGPIFPLPAAALEAERRQKLAKEMGRDAYMSYHVGDRQRDLRQAFAQHSVLAALANYLERATIRP